MPIGWQFAGKQSEQRAAKSVQAGRMSSEESPRLRRKKSESDKKNSKDEERPTSPTKLMPEKEEATVELMVELEKLRKESTLFGRLKKKHEDLERKVGTVQGTLTEVQEQQREERREAKALQDELLRRIESLGG